MTYGWVVLRAGLGAFCLFATLGAGLAQPPVTPTVAKATPSFSSTTAKPSTEKTATIVSQDADAVHLTLADGSPLDAGIRPSSVCLQSGLLVTPAQFAAGAKVYVRTRMRASDGAVSLVLLCDPASAAAIETYRHKVLAGTVQSVDEKYLVVKPPSAVPVTLRVTPKTVYRKGGADVTVSAFPPGTPVAVVARGLPNGLLMASVVSDRDTDAVREGAARRPHTLSGVAADVQADKNLILIAPKTRPRQTIAVGEATHVKVRKIEATLKDVQPGMRVSARLGPDKDAAGHALATSLSAYDAASVTHKASPAAHAKSPTAPAHGKG